MLKMTLFDCAIDEKCCSVDGGRGICPLFSSPPGGFDSSRVPTPWPGICHEALFGLCVGVTYQKAVT